MSRLLLAPIATLALAGCNPTQKVTVTSEPPFARVEVDGNPDTFHYTPVDLQLAQRSSHTLVVSLPGYHSLQVRIAKDYRDLSHAAGSGEGGVLVGLVAGIAELATGAVVRLQPDKVNVVLERAAPGMKETVLDWELHKPVPACKPKPSGEAKPSSQRPPYEPET